MPRRTLAFALLAAICVAGATATGAIAVLGAKHDRKAASKAVAAERPKANQILVSKQPFAVLRTVDQAHQSTYGRVAVAPLVDGKPGAPALVGPACERVGFRAGKGLCLEVLGTQMGVDFLDARMQTVRQLTLPGIPSRARVSPDGRWGGVTAFIVGHAYTTPGQFSTAATILDMQTGKVVGNLEKDFKVYDGGKLVDAVDRNYWGLTFAADGDTFYATLETSGKTWLIKGSIKARRAETIHANVECPALSPDGTRIGYKKAMSHDPTVWRFHVLDLATGKETALSETRSVDDQIEWLDDSHLVYGDKANTWVVNADGTGSPQMWLRNTDSPTVQGGSGAST
ncbi:hypothetical protein OM076_34505 [Solirubrobacter ginsenosidimutans]|uniref:TolB-like translocation protein n=1 Tax=Solirubrobacter ginsenosidimutans TaxID=490573 RepID=A0A9X3MZJ1_9ACTN|nr:hypothetical protein [Solirubrobacter ginsenosidimutans]MDA0165432.1 hypothetical protein [Solirubrobacter ginsenosidimutans]